MTHDFNWCGEPTNFAKLIAYFRLRARNARRDAKFWRERAHVAIEQRREQLARENERIAA